MLMVFSPIFVTDTKIIFRYDFVAPLLTNFKKPDTIFCLYPFSNIKKVYLQILKNLAQFFCLSLFQIYIKKSILANLKKPGAIFLLISF